MTHRFTILGLSLAIALSGEAAVAQMQHGASHGMTGTTPKAQDTPSTKAFKAAATKMHKDMDIAYSGDADFDFVKGMIPHHQAAIEMAKIQLEYGKDPETRRLAEEIITAQEAEIAEMQTWLRTRGK